MLLQLLRHVLQSYTALLEETLSSPGEGCPSSEGLLGLLIKPSHTIGSTGSYLIRFNQHLISQIL